MLFSDSEVRVVGFDHTETIKKGKTEASCQCIGLSVENKSSNTFDVQTVATQTDDNGAFVVGNIDSNALKNCLEKTLTFLETECDEWPTINDCVETAENDANVDDKMIKVSAKRNSPLGTKNISAICWNSTGVRLFVATGEYRHSQWCNHRNAIFMYSTSDLEKGSNVATYTAEVASCVTCLATHPSNERVITAGLYNGELLVRDAGDELAAVALAWHSQAVSEVTWFAQSDRRLLLITAGRDGYVCLGTIMNQNIKLIRRVCRYVVGIPGQIGVRRFDYSDRNFLIALENGEVSSFLSKTIQNVTDDKVLEAVKVQTYKGHLIMIDNVKFCPNNLNKFFITQFDCTILLYDVYKEEPQQIIFNKSLIIGSCWSLSNEFIIYIGEEDGDLSKINLKNGKINLFNKITTCNLTLMTVNPIRKNIIAICTLHEEIYLCKCD